MPYYSKKHILFIHIPKTGGTTIEKSLKINDIQKLYSNRTNKLLPSPFNKKSLQHQFYTTIYKYRKICSIKFNSKLKIITVVRNPYNKIMSGLFWNKLINKYSTQEEVYHAIKKYLKGNYDNHNVPQYKFISDYNGKLIPNIKIFKTETLNKDIKKYLGINIINHSTVGKEKEKKYNKYLNNNSITTINLFYKNDFELFNYNMKSEC